jgi:hypothetical protein
MKKITQMNRSRIISEANWAGDGHYCGYPTLDYMYAGVKDSDIPKLENLTKKQRSLKRKRKLYGKKITAILSKAIERGEKLKKVA